MTFGTHLVFLKIVTQLQSMYKACSVSKGPTAIIF